MRSRLAHRGLALSAVAFEVALTDAASAGTLPASLFDTTLKAAVNTATGSTAVAEGVSTQALTLAEGVSKAMFLTRLKLATAVLLAFCVIGTGATLMIYNSSAADPNEEKQNLPPKPKPPTDEEKLQGTWMINNPESLQQGTRWTFNSGQLEGYSKPEKGIITHYKLDPEQKPKTIDLTIQSGNDGPIVAQIKGIYQLDGDELKIRFADGDERPKAFPVGAAVSVIILKREAPAKVTFLDKRGGKPPMRFYHVTLELTNPRDQPVWLLTRDSGEEPLKESGKFTDKDGGKPQMFGGAHYDGKKGGKGEAVQVSYIGCFRAFYLAPKTTVRFDRYEISCWEDIKHFEVWEVSSLLVNGRTALEKWLPYPTRNEGDIVIPAMTDWGNLDFDRKTSQSRKDYPNERIEFVQAEVIKKWLLPIVEETPNAAKPPKTPLEELQGAWHVGSGEFQGKPLTKEQLEEDFEKLIIKQDEYMEVHGDFRVVWNIKLDPTKMPKTFDLISRTNMVTDGVKSVTESVTGRGIYQLDGDTLKIAQAGQDKEVRPTGFKTTADTKYAVYTFKRGEPPAKPEGPKQPEFVEAEITLRRGLGVQPGAQKEDLTKIVKDKATLAKFASCFPEAGRGKKSNTAGGWIPNITFKFTGSKGEIVNVSSTWTNWSEGHGDWLVKANLMKYAGELFEVPHLIDQGNLMDDWQLMTFEDGGKKRDTKNVELQMGVGDFEELRCRRQGRMGSRVHHRSEQETAGDRPDLRSLHQEQEDLPGHLLDRRQHPEDLPRQERQEATDRVQDDRGQRQRGLVHPEPQGDGPGSGVGPGPCRHSATEAQERDAGREATGTERHSRFAGRQVDPGSDRGHRRPDCLTT